MKTGKQPKYRFFKLKDKDFEDFTRASDLKHAQEIFKYHHPERKGKVVEIKMTGDFGEI